MLPKIFTAKSRVMLVAPHPDDESLAAGILLQKAVAAGADIRVVYITDGDDNPWPQRAMERKWRLSATDRKRWGQRRRREAIAALETLGLRAADARFLGMPDQGLTHLLLHDCRKTAARFSHMIADWAPTHLLSPSAADTHPDHSALAILLRFAIADFLARHDFVQWSYLVHGRRSLFGKDSRELVQSMREGTRKQLAIVCHATQVKFSRRRFLAYARRAEIFLRDDFRSTYSGTPIRSIRRSGGTLHLQVRFSLKPLRAEETTLYLIGHDRAGAVVSFCLQLPARHARVQVTDLGSGHRVAIATYRGNAFHGAVALPLTRFAPDRPIYLKLNRRSYFFDEAGWLEIAAEKTFVESEPFPLEGLARLRAAPLP